MPPMYSAKKVQGKKLYELARTGQNIERKANEIEVYDIKLLSLRFSNSPIPYTITINCHVSSGTYIRTLAHEIGQKLGGRDHSTVIHACDKIRKGESVDESLKQELVLIKERIYNSFDA